MNNKKWQELFINNIKYAIKNNIQYRIYTMMETINDLKFSKEDFDEFKNIMKNIGVDYIKNTYFQHRGLILKILALIYLIPNILLKTYSYN